MRAILSLLKLLFGYRRAMGELRKALAQQTLIEAVLNPFRAGDYESALEAAESIKAASGECHEYCFYRGTLLMYLSRFEESEKWLRKLVAIPQSDNKLSALGWSTLGALYLAQRRLDEAMDCFEQALTAWPERGSAYRDIAEVWLRRGDSPSEALKNATIAVEKDRTRDHGAKEVHDLNLGENLATLAWATAVVSRDQKQVDQLVTEAADLVRGGSVQTVAQAHSALNNLSKSAQHFDEAARIDPKGLWGRAARAAAAGVAK
jgi:tetratricopeptide (TPR) repeat protein